VDGGNWRGEGWPGTDAPARQRLPRVEDLPPEERGYDRQKVREAFDSFYRHIAQLDSTLRALEAVEVFRDQAGELRKELRALKAAGWTQQPWPSYAPARSAPGLPESLPRFAIEAAFLVIVAVVVAVSGFDRLSIVLVMALAWAIVGLVEWAASRERFARARAPVPVRAAVPARTRPEELAPAPLRIVAADPVAAEPSEGWAVSPAEPEEEHTVVRPAEGEAAALEPEPTEPAAEVEAAEPEVEAEPGVAAEAAPQLEPEPDAELQPPDADPEPPDTEESDEQPGRWSWAADAAVERARERELADRAAGRRRRWWQRRPPHDGFRFDQAQPRHVRVIPPEPSFDEQFPVESSSRRVDPWEEELDISIDEPGTTVEPEATVEPERTVEPEPQREHAFAERDAGETR
jgi:hypothetical protein